jgi:neutral ceramidase
MYKIVCPLLLLILTLVPVYLHGEGQFLVGTGISDITGPAAEVGMMGYANIDQQTGGIHTRLWARAFVIQGTNGKRFVFVNSDLGMIMQATKMKVVEKLQKQYGNLYDHANVILSATHTHSGPGGFSHYALYNITILGFCRQNFNAIVDGICAAIGKAHNNMSPCRIYMATGTLDNTTKNRSLEAYEANTDANLYPPCDDTMVVLKFRRDNGKEIGMLNWFAVHATSMGNQNKLVSSDNKGWAERKFEEKKGSDYQASGDTFIAAFANGPLGDASPNIYGGEDGGGVNDFASTAISGEKQFQLAWRLYHEANDEIVPGNLAYRHLFYDFSRVTVAPQFADGQTRHTAFAALGLAFAAGAEDGPSNIPFIKEGDYKGHYHEAHGYKPIFLETGNMKPYPWTPEVLPVQIVTLGRLAILAVPGEFTTHAGRRLKNAVRDDLSALGIDTLIVSGPANSYAGYVTTLEEYNKQHYEGASTHFGQWTLGAYCQAFKILSASLKDGTMPDAGPQPRDLSDQQTELQPGVLFDAPPLFKDFGDVEKNAPASIERMNVLQVVFWGAHPRNNLKTNDSYLYIERKTAQGWQIVRRDYDLDTAFVWARDGIACSKITVVWEIGEDVAAGVYRIYHSASYKDGLSGEIKPYSGYSREFNVVPCSRLTVAKCQVNGSEVRFTLQYPPATAKDLGNRTSDVATGKIRFTVNGGSTVYEALPVAGQNIFLATLPVTVQKVSVPTGYAVDAYGNSNQAFSYGE